MLVVKFKNQNIDVSNRLALIFQGKSFFDLKVWVLKQYCSGVRVATVKTFLRMAKVAKISKILRSEKTRSARFWKEEKSVKIWKYHLKLRFGHLRKLVFRFSIWYSLNWAMPLPFLQPLPTTNLTSLHLSFRSFHTGCFLSVMLYGYILSVLNELH